MRGVRMSLLSRQLVESYLGKPGLVRETSRVGVLASFLCNLRCVLQSAVVSVRGGRDVKKAGESWCNQTGVSAREKADREFQDVVLSPDLKEQVRYPDGVESVTYFTLTR